MFTIILFMASSSFSDLLKDGDIVDSLTFNEPWYAVHAPDSSKSIFVIDNNGDLFLGQSIDSIHLKTPPLRSAHKSYVLKSDSIDNLIANIRDAYVRGSIFTYAEIPLADDDDLVFRNGNKVPVALFDGEFGNLYLKGGATMIRNIRVTTRNNGTLFPEEPIAYLSSDSSWYPLEAHAEKGYSFYEWKYGKRKNAIIADSSEYKTTVKGSGEADIIARFIREPFNSIDFTAADSQYVPLPEMTIDGSNGLTLETWFRWDTIVDVSSTLLQLSNGDTTQNAPFIELSGVNDSTGNINVIIQNMQCAHSKIPQRFELTSNKPFVITDNWTHVALVFSDSNVALYKNGIIDSLIVTDCTLPKTIFTTNAIGASLLEADTNGEASIARYFNGQLDETRIWQRALSVDTIKALMHKKLTGDEKGLIVDYSYNSFGGTTLFDKSLQHHHTKTVNINSTDWKRSYISSSLRITKHRNGKTIPEGTVKVAQKQRIPIKAIPNRGYAFKMWEPSGKVVVGDTLADSTYVEMKRYGRLMAQFIPLNEWFVFDQSFVDTTGSNDSIRYHATGNTIDSTGEISLEFKTDNTLDSLYCYTPQPTSMIKDSVWKVTLEGYSKGDSLKFYFSHIKNDTLRMEEDSRVHTFVIP
ncbi:MAG: LamG domain-containing protein [Reichenbachiella sp.]